MNDTCFLCLEMTKQYQCTRCKILCHNKCWEIYRREHYYLINLHVYSNCPQCNQQLSGISFRPTTRSYSKTHVEKAVIVRLEELLLESQLSSDLSVKRQSIRQAFECLKDNLWFLENSEVFTNALKNKMIEFIQ